jgi:hypothetical protein
MKEMGLLIDFYLLGIDASIKAGNPDEMLLEQACRVATNDPSIMLRKLRMKIYYFEISRICDVRISDVIEEIEGIGIEAENKIHERYRMNKDFGVFKENIEYLEECHNKYIYLCDRKRVEPNIVKKTIDKCRKEGFFVNIVEEVEASFDQEKSQEKMFSQLKGVQDVKKKSMIQWMEMRIKEAEDKQFVVPRIGLRHHAVMNEGLQNKFRMIEEASCYADLLCAGCEEDEMYMETFVEFVTKVLQRHVGEAYGKMVVVRNSRRTIPDENKLRNKAINVVRLSNGKEIRTENVAEINSNVIKAEMSAISIRAVIENYKIYLDQFMKLNLVVIMRGKRIQSFQNQKLFGVILK